MIQRIVGTGHRRAAAAVEFGVIAPVFFIFVLGMVEVGRGIMVKHQLTNAARLACRVGVVEGKTYSNIHDAAQTYLTGQGFSGDIVAIQVNDVTDTSANFAANPGDEITVRVSVSTDSVSWVPWPKFMTGGTLTGRYTLRRE
jgi:Flp pilus assembly protein TadG